MKLKKQIAGHDYDKYVTIQELNFTARLVQANLASKNNIANFILVRNRKYLNKKVTSDKVKRVFLENKLNELSKNVEAISAKGTRKDLINVYKLWIVQNNFIQNITKLLISLSANKYFNFFSRTTEIYFWKSNKMSEKYIEKITTSDNNFAPTFIDTRPSPDVKFNGHCSINKLPDSGKVTSLYISYALGPWSRDLNTDFTLNNCLFGSLKLTKNADPGE